MNLTCEPFRCAGNDAEYLVNVNGTWCGFSRCAFLVQLFSTASCDDVHFKSLPVARIRLWQLTASSLLDR